MASAKTCLERLAPPYGVVSLDTLFFYTFPVFDQFIGLNLYPENQYTQLTDKIGTDTGGIYR